MFKLLNAFKSELDCCLGVIRISWIQTVRAACKTRVVCHAKSEKWTRSCPNRRGRERGGERDTETLWSRRHVSLRCLQRVCYSCVLLFFVLFWFRETSRLGLNGKPTPPSSYSWLTASSAGALLPSQLSTHTPLYLLYHTQTLPQLASFLWIHFPLHDAANEQRLAFTGSPFKLNANIALRTCPSHRGVNKPFKTNKQKTK